MESTVTFDDTDGAGTWSAAIEGIQDTNDNYEYINISPAKIVSLGFAPYISVVNPKIVDTTPPEFRGIEFSANQVDVSAGSQTIAVKVYVYDAESKPNYLSLNISAPEDLPYSHNKHLSFDQYTVSGWKATETIGVYSNVVNLTFDKNSGAGKWSAEVSWINDSSNNSPDNYPVASSLQIVQLGFDPYIVVTNPFEVDITPPDFVGLEFSTNKVDISSGKQLVTIKAFVYEAESKPTYLYLRLEPPKGISTNLIKHINISQYDGSGWVASDVEGIYTNQTTVEFSINDALGKWSTKVTQVEDTNRNYNYSYGALLAEQIEELGSNPYIKVINSDVQSPDLSLATISDGYVSSSKIESRFELNVTNYSELPTSFDFDFTFSDKLRYDSLTLVGASTQSQSCSINFGSGSCSVSVSDDWTTLTFVLGFKAGVTGEHEVSADVIFNGYEADTDNNQALHNFTSVYRSRVAHDVDGDGKADILWRNSDTGQNWLWTMNGLSLIKSAGINISADLTWQMVGRGDFDGDGKSDIVWRNRSSGRNYVYLMDGFKIKEQGELNYVTDSNWLIKQVADFDGDGKDDILWHHAIKGDTHIYLMEGLKYRVSKAALKIADLDWEIAATGDINGDGKSDVIWRNTFTSENYIWLMDGTNISSRYLLNNVHTGWKLVGSGDLNGDGTDDIVWRNVDDGRNWLHIMKNGKIQSSQLINTVPNLDWYIADIADFDGDGKADLFWRQKASGQASIFLMWGATVNSQGYLNSVNSVWQSIH